jgi:hypothetical protein
VAQARHGVSFSPTACPHGRRPFAAEADRAWSQIENDALEMAGVYQQGNRQRFDSLVEPYLVGSAAAQRRTRRLMVSLVSCLHYTTANYERDTGIMNGVILRKLETWLERGGYPQPESRKLGIPKRYPDRMYFSFWFQMPFLSREAMHLPCSHPAKRPG